MGDYEKAVADFTEAASDDTNRSISRKENLAEFESKINQ